MKSFREYYEQQDFITYKGNIILSDSKIKNLGRLKIITGWLDLTNTKNLKSLGNLEVVGGNLYLNNSSIEDLGNLKYVGGSLYLNRTENIKSLGNLEEIGDSLSLYNLNIEDLGKLKKVRLIYGASKEIREKYPQFF